MKNFIKVVILSVAGLMVMVSTSQAADFKCAKMKVTNITPNGVWVQNVTGAACGIVANNAQQYFILNPSTTDRLLAISLTAVSLQKTVWVHALDDAQGSIVDVISLSD